MNFLTRGLDLTSKPIQDIGVLEEELESGDHLYVLRDAFVKESGEVSYRYSHHGEFYYWQWCCVWVGLDLKT